uniref:Kinesin motor domain-containing protein n=1 Tax=Chenopodium quinoa TaxID=63459 RepID=A0A803MSA1_CHEQI
MYCRERPFLPWQANGFTTVDHIEEGNITLMNPTKYCKDGKKSFNFNKVFGPDSTQAEVYTDMQPLIRSCLDGYNVCIFTYWKIGSGKTLPVSTTADVISLMNHGHKNRAVSSRAMNDRSNCSHSCMIIHFQGKDLALGAALRGCMHLVDLAGSESIENFEVTGDRLKDAHHINKSLAALGY